MSQLWTEANTCQGDPKTVLTFKCSWAPDRSSPSAYWWLVVGQFTKSQLGALSMDRRPLPCILRSHMCRAVLPRPGGFPLATAGWSSGSWALYCTVLHCTPGLSRVG